MDLNLIILDIPSSLARNQSYYCEQECDRPIDLVLRLFFLFLKQCVFFLILQLAFRYESVMLV